MYKYFDRMITTILGVEYSSGNHTIKCYTGRNEPIHLECVVSDSFGTKTSLCAIVVNFTDEPRTELSTEPFFEK